MSDLEQIAEAVMVALKIGPVPGRTVGTNCDRVQVLDPEMDVSVALYRSYDLVSGTYRYSCDLIRAGHVTVAH